MTKSITWQCRRNSASSLHSLFAVVLTWCEPSNPLDIYEHHKEENFLCQQRTKLNDNDLGFNDNIFSLALNDFQDKVLSMGGRELSEFGLPQPQVVDNDRLARVYRREIDYNQGEQTSLCSWQISERFMIAFVL